MFVKVQVDLIGWFEEVPFQGSSAHIDDVNLSCPSLYATFILYHIFSSLSRGFEKSFLSFFRSPSRSSRFRSWRDFYIISYLKPFVKWFFKNSWNSFLKLFFELCRFARLLCSLAHSFNIIPHSAADVNPFFDFFLDSSHLLHIPIVYDVWMYKCNRFW